MFAGSWRRSRSPGSGNVQGCSWAVARTSVGVQVAAVGVDLVKFCWRGVSMENRMALQFLEVSYTSIWW